jgi:hypothetical protein
VRPPPGMKGIGPSSCEAPAYWATGDEYSGIGSWDMEDNGELSHDGEFGGRMWYVGVL